jgi:DNA-directed RNA polymerase subunit beta'
VLKDAAVIAEASGTIRFGKVKNKRRIIIESSVKVEVPKEYLIPKGKHPLADGDVSKGDYIVEVTRRRTVLAIRRRGTRELSGQRIQDRSLASRSPTNIEVPSARCCSGGNRAPAKRADPRRADDKIVLTRSTRGRPRARGRAAIRCCSASPRPRCRPARSSRRRRSRTTRAHEAAVNGKVDTLEGLRERRVGRLIPAGTGAAMNGLREVAGSATTILEMSGGAAGRGQGSGRRRCRRKG